MNELDTNTAQKINALHEGIMSLLHQGIEKAIEIGELLTAKKAELKHGEFGTWIKDNLIFTDRTAQRYIKIYENKDRVLQAGNISEAYKILGDGKNDTVSDFEEGKMETVYDFYRTEKILNELIWHIKNELPCDDLRNEAYKVCNGFIMGCEIRLNSLPGYSPIGMVIPEEGIELSFEEWKEGVKRYKEIFKETQEIELLVGELSIRDRRKLGKPINESEVDRKMNVFKRSRRF